MIDTALQAREIADAIMDIFQPGSRKTEHYRRMRSAVLETLMPALTTYGNACYREGVEEAAEAVQHEWQSASNERTDSVFTSYRQNAIGPGCSASLAVIRALVSKEKETEE
jgi:hypothetical protein